MKTNQLKYAAAITLATMLASATTGWAAGASPFPGHWEATDIDGSDIRLSIGGPPGGPFQITWTESYISFCDGGPGIVRGTGALNGGDPYLMEADLTVECLRTGETLAFHLSFYYHPFSDVLTTSYDGLWLTIFHRPGTPPPAPPALGLRVNYGHDWVESFYGGGHLAWITVTEDDGTTVKATAEVITEPKDFWDGETGFQTNPEDWDPDWPDIQPGDWVFGWIDNGASAQVQIGEVGGFINFESDSVAGSINAPWISESVEVECHPWGAPEPAEMKFSSVVPNGSDSYACNWSGEWNLEPGQDVGVAYTGPDGHWVANAFTAQGGIVGSETGNWFWIWDFAPSTAVAYQIYESAEPGASLLSDGTAETDEGGFAIVDDSEHSLDLVPGNYLVVFDDSRLKGLVLEPIMVGVFDPDNETMAGTGPAGQDLWVAAGPQEYQTGMTVVADAVTGEWYADFKEIPFDITEEMRPWSYAQIFDDDGDISEADPPPRPEIRAWLGNQRIEGYQWLLGEWISLEVYDPLSGETFSGLSQVEGDQYWTHVDFSTEGWDLQPDQEITMSGYGLTKTHTILPVRINSVNPDLELVSGSSSEEAWVVLCVYDGGCDPPAEIQADASGTWSMDYTDQLDIYPGIGMDATEFDEDGDGTSYEYWSLTSVLWAFPEADQIYGYGWPEGTEVSLAINDSNDIQTVAVQGAPWDANDIMAFFEFGELHDLQAGDVVTLSGSGTERTHVVMYLSVTEVDDAAETVKGNADPGSEVHVWVHGLDGSDIYLIADDGAWLADFAAEEIDLLQDICGRAEILSEGDNSTAVDWCVEPQLWVGAYFYDPEAGSLASGGYHFEFTWTVPEYGFWSDQEGELDLSSSAPFYDGYVLLRGPVELRGVDTGEGLTCEEVSQIHPDQQARFFIGFAVYGEMFYADALAHFGSVSGSVVWGDGIARDLVRADIVLLFPDDLESWFSYVCTYTR